MEFGTYEHPEQVGWQGWMREGSTIVFVGLDGHCKMFRCDPATGAVLN